MKSKVYLMLSIIVSAQFPGGIANAASFKSLTQDGYKSSRMMSNKIGYLGWKMTKAGQPTWFCHFSGVAVFEDEMKDMRAGKPADRYIGDCVPFR